MVLSHNSTEKTIVRRHYLLFALLCCFVGGALALYATNLTLLLVNNLASSNDGCSVNAWISCNAVLSTKFANMFGIPVAWLGFLFYLWASLTLLIALLRKNTERSVASASAVLVGGSMAVMFSIYKAVQLIILQKLCPVCAGMYLMNILILLFLMHALGLKYRWLGIFLFEYFKSLIGLASKLTFSPRPVLYSIAIVWIFTFGYVGIVKYEKYLGLIKSEEVEKPFVLEEALEEHFDESPLEIPIDPNAAFKGDKNAGITIVEFADFECPACKIIADSMHSIIEQYDGKVRLYFMNYPLDVSINHYMKHDLHNNSGLAAVAGIYAQSRGEFWAFHDEVFKDQKNINRQFLIELVKNTAGT